MGKQVSRLTQYLSEAISFPHRVLLPFSLHSVCVDKASQTWDSLTQWFQVETNAETIKALVALDEAGGGQGLECLTLSLSLPLQGCPRVSFWVTLGLQMSCENHWSGPTFPLSNKEAEAQSG